MNGIEAILTKSKFVDEPHLVIVVDGVPLDELVDDALPGSNLKGSVSSLLGWFRNEEDNAVPWQRILPEIGCTGYAPILICPDDLDLSCGVVMVEVLAERDVVRWNRVGLDATKSGAVGSCIRWEDSLGPYAFRRADYERCLAAFARASGRGSDAVPSERGLISESIEEDYKSQFPYLDMSPEEYVARHSHNILCFGLHLYQFRDSRLKEWFVALHGLLRDRKRVLDLRRQYLTPSEIEEAERRENEI